ncbi:MAG: NADH-quinone oxidoreductase subunit J [Anaerolineales bacterium]|nr:NADH-quinone oxidoreductase subunit J [Anaerolineales bacterium]
MNGELILFFVLAAVAIGAALGMLFSRNAVYSALFLILNFATVAVFFLLLGAPFIAMAQVTVYAGAIMVLFLFVIMLLGAEHIQHAARRGWQRPLAMLLTLVLLAESAYLIFTRSDLLTVLQPAASDYGNPQAIGMLLFSEYLLPFEVTSILLLAAMVGAIVLVKEDKKRAGGQE